MIFWFRKDLRLHDNPALSHAAEMLKLGRFSNVIPLYCYDPRDFEKRHLSHCDLPKTFRFRTKFLTESLCDLRRRLQSIGSDIAIVHGCPEEVIPRIMSATGAKSIIAQPEVRKAQKFHNFLVERYVNWQYHSRIIPCRKRPFVTPVETTFST